QICSIGTYSGGPFLALEFCPGGTLHERLRAGPVSSRTAALLVDGLARAVEYAHQQGILHRDLKPANVLLTSGPDVPLDEACLKIADFGLAKIRVSAEDVGQSLELAGTPSYMSPEQARGKDQPLGPQTDVYALGAILYDVLTGRPPFNAATPLETLEQVRSQEPVPPH